MITLHRLGHAVDTFQINPDAIITIEATPDTVITILQRPEDRRGRAARAGGRRGQGPTAPGVRRGAPAAPRAAPRAQRDAPRHPPAQALDADARCMTRRPRHATPESLNHAAFTAPPPSFFRPCRSKRLR